MVIVLMAYRPLETIVAEGQGQAPVSVGDVIGTQVAHWFGQHQWLHSLQDGRGGYRRGPALTEHGRFTV